MKKGQISTLVAIIGMAGAIGASVITNWATFSFRIGQTETKVGIIEERENNHYLEIKQSLQRIENTLKEIKNQKSVSKKDIDEDWINQPATR